MWRLLILLSVFTLVQATHFRGAIFTWEPTGNPNEIRVSYRISWRRDSTGGGHCDGATISTGRLIGEGSMSCFAGCSISTLQPMDYHCTDYSVLENWSTGRMTRIVNITNGPHFEIGFSGGDWISTLRYGADSSWTLRAVGNLTTRRDTGRINSSPTADIAPIVRLQSRCNHTIALLVNDADRDVVRCRLARNNGPFGDECNGVCNSCPNCIIDENTCRVHYNAIYGTGWYALAIQIEDFMDSSSTTPLSSVPLQFLLHVESSLTSCHRGPHFVSPTPPDRACYGVSTNDEFEAEIVARIDQSSLNGTYITEIETVSPLGMQKTPLTRVSSTDWMINVTWQYSYNSSINNDFCFTAYDSSGAKSNTRCLSIVAGIKPPSFIHGSLKNRHIGNDLIKWTINVNQPISRPSRSVYIRLFNNNGTELQRLDASQYNAVTFPGSSNTTISFITNASQPADQDYYFVFDQGVVKGATYCGVENPSNRDIYNWKVHIYRHTPVRLVNGKNKYEGRVEVFYQGQWGTVCDDYFNETDAEVFCRMLGYTWVDHPPIKVYPSTFYGRGSGDIIIDDLMCQGDEIDVVYCKSRPWLENDCAHTEDVGIDCGYPIRLVDGNNSMSGRLEIFNNSRWETVCSREFTTINARVVCVSLGFNFSGSPLVNSYTYGKAYQNISDNIWHCNGDEDELFECWHRQRHYYDYCYHSTDVNIDCGSPFRLVNGIFGKSGRLEIYNGSNWETVCDQNFHSLDAEVVCNYLGYSSSFTYNSSIFGQGTGEISNTEWSCNGYETDLRDCRKYDNFFYSCSHQKDVGIICGDLPVRLVNGPDWRAGRIELFYNNEWGTVCDDDFNIYAARIVCNMIGYNTTRYPTVYTGGYYGYGNGPIMLDGFSCTGYETSLLQCIGQPFYRHDCGHNEDAGVDCTGQARTTVLETTYLMATQSPVSVRLVDGTGYYNGRVEIYYRGQWGTVCDDNFDSNDAYVICRMIGYSNNRWPLVHPSAYYGQGRGYIVVDELQCNGFERSIEYCRSNTWLSHDCSHSEDVGIDCRVDMHSTSPSMYVTTETYFRLEDAIHASCNEYGWDITVDMNMMRMMYPNIKASDVYLGKNLCTGLDYGSSLLFHQGLRECLTTETISGTDLIYRNELVYAIHDPLHPFIIRRYNWTVEVECDVSRNQTAAGHLHHDYFNSTSHHVTGMSNYSIQMSFFLDPNFITPIPGNPLHVAVGTKVYVKVFTTTSDWDIKMVVHDCYTRPSPTATDHVTYAIIRNGCEVDTNTHIISQSTHETKFVFEDFEYTSNHEGIYLYCDATFCGSSDFSFHCQQRCQSFG